MGKRKLLRDQEGFTLVEIIAVVAILGVLAAVAVPKYMGLQTQSKVSAAQAALGSGTSQVSLAYANCIVMGSVVIGFDADAFITTGNTCPTISTSIGDFVMVYRNAWPSVSVSVGSGPRWYNSDIASSVGSKTVTFN